VTFDYNGLELKTRQYPVKTQTPQWNQMFDLHVRDLADEIVFKIWDKHMFYSTPIGLFNIKVSALCINRGNMHDENINLDFPILYDNK